MFKTKFILLLTLLTFTSFFISCGKDVSDRCKVSMQLDGETTSDNGSSTACGVLDPSFVFLMTADFENKGKLVVQVEDINSATTVNLSKSVTNGGVSFTAPDGTFYHVGPDGTAKSKFKMTITKLEEEFSNNEKHATGTFSGLLYTLDGKDSIDIKDGEFKH